jgi:hypothetical protein
MLRFDLAPKMKRNRRSFLKAALGCATALVVPGVLPRIPTPEPEIKITTWYKPGIWAMPKGSAKLIPGVIIIKEIGPIVHVTFDNG